MVYSSARSNQKFLNLQSVQSIIVGGIKIVSLELPSDPSSFSGNIGTRTGFHKGSWGTIPLAKAC